ncbi:thioredoxin fold domain-containing protein [Legionella saoudiensis]|uniref:thioredoxin fold domain-containing protein n=1 Tax=Legionella saoudiensis TaxID=1750561 RepID=UPI0007302363|nr:thioredoxin fold domain-containing protein [Legionella saoudiensis]
MKWTRLVKQIGINLSIFYTFVAYAGTPLWTITPVPGFPPKIQIRTTDTAQVKYIVTNQSRKPHALQIKPIQGIIASGCSFPLSAYQSCTLTLDVNMGLTRNIKGGPILCSQGNSNQCYQPNPSDILDIKILLPAEVSVRAFYGSVFFAQPEVVLNPYFGDLLKYEVIFPSESHWASQKGVVDVNGQFIIIEGKIIRNPAEITLLLSSSTRIPITPPYQPFTSPGSSNDIANLLAYQTADKQIVFIDQFQRYAVVGGQTIQVTPPPSSQAWTFLDYISNLPENSYGNNSQVPSNISYEVVRSLASFVQGNPSAPKTIYVFGEPNCSICHEFYESMQPYVINGQVSIHWILVSFLQPSSQGKVWSILDGRVPSGSGYPATAAGAFAYNEDNFNTVNESGGIPPSTNPSNYAIRSLNENEQAFIRYTGIIGTPTIIYISTQGQTTVMIGTPQDYTTFVNDIRG